MNGGVVALLSVGEDNALSARELAGVMGWNVRDVTRAIQRARVAGAPICASSSGYYLGGNADELRRYVRALDRRLREIRKTREGLGRALDAATGQTRLELPSGEECY